MARMAGTAALAEKLLDVAVVSTTSVAGGDICTTTRLRLTDGRSAIIKTRPQAPAGFFTTEAEGLRRLRAAGGVKVPEVLAADDECIILAWVEPTKPSVDLAESFGRGLAALHASGTGGFGADHDGWIGLAPLPNRPSPTWEEFYASRRVMPYVKAAADRGSLSLEQARVIEQVMKRLPSLTPDPEPPSLLHGDLWSGNLVWSSEGVHLVDPAAHGGHRETDLAMLALFGAPHLQRILDAYHEAAPLQDGWLDRVPLHQLHPLLVHAVMFGGAYGARAAAAAQSLLDGAA
ncbi:MULTISPECIES: fructosamine kinase family protein [Aeromicrobium]|uniref:Fructosamine kinase family protein n=1 Tax=Aeromicrobium phoceense TaxID=2754045 RepID=A0A838XG85_9ACTN|nr:MULTISPECIES: fructosamine kinase family protein [Aeromicrobium]MBA4607676.1 fructosamine kinase family protein [Aeromicrobium phoceense]